MNQIVTIILASIIFSWFFYVIPNNSNINKIIIIPIIVALVVKYIFGDWDYGSKYSWYDVIYFIVIILFSIITIKTLDMILIK
tara:strand:- start:304 stop:552 length:249 start_codon:yes stop_codon:yes gene_type:complete